MISITRPFWVICIFSLSIFGQSGKLGVFTNSGDVGAPAIKGNAEFNSSIGEYRITGSGSNMWAKQDQFQYAWKEMSGNFSVTATLRFLGQGADHRKAGIMLRQSQDTDAAYADVVIHGNGMPALQWRSRKGEDTNTFDLPFDGPGMFQIKLVRNGVRVYMYLGKDGETPKEIAHTEVSLRDPVLVGLAVCSHQAAAKDTVVFSGVQIEQRRRLQPQRPRSRSKGDSHQQIPRAALNGRCSAAGARGPKPGGPIQNPIALAGHRDVAITKRYVHPQADMIRAAMDRARVRLPVN